MFKQNKKKIYLDYAAGTPIDPAVFRVMRPYMIQNYSNPSVLYSIGVEAKNEIEEIRKIIARFLHATNDSIIFSRGGTHSINMALLGIARKHYKKGKHIITTEVEHHAVLNTVRQLEREGFKITYLPVDQYGFITAEQLKDEIREDTILVSVMYANNEIGTVEPIADIGKMLLQYRKNNNTRYPYFHTDACQAIGLLEMSVEKLHIDLLSFNGSKIYGPKGIGVLYKRRGVELEPILFGGGQEFGLSPGSEDVAGIIGIGKAVSMADEDKLLISHIVELRNYFWRYLQTKIDDIVLNGPSIVMTSKAGNLFKSDEIDCGRLGNNLNISFLGANSEAVILYLDAKGIYVGSGSACDTDNLQMSHVLKSCGYDYNRMKSSVRFSFGKYTKKKDLDYVLKLLPNIVKNSRLMNM